MKVKIGNKSTTLPKDIVICHMANLLASRAVILKKEKDFKTAFDKFRNLCEMFIKQDKKFSYAFGEDEWLQDFLDFETKQHELLMQEIFFQFSDNSTWSIALNDLANLKILQEHDKKLDKNKLLSEPIELAQWAQENLSWSQVKAFASIRKFESKDDDYEKEWPEVNKKIVKYSYDVKK